MKEHQMKPLVLHRNYDICAKKIWSFDTTCPFNTISVDVLFGSTKAGSNSRCVILGGEDGVVRVYNIPDSDGAHSSNVTPQACMETKSGAIQCVAVHDVTRFYDKDLIVGHSSGMVTVFSNHHILSRRQLSDHSIDLLQISHDPLGSISLLMADDAGLIAAVSPSCDLWRVNLNDVKHSKKPSGTVSVTSLACLTLTSADGDTSMFTLAADTVAQLHAFRQGSLVLTLQAPSVVTSMCVGQFMDVAKLTFNQRSMPACKDMTQVALGTQTGNVYIMADFAISGEEYCTTGLPITHTQSLHLPSHDLDFLVCTGHFNSVQIFHDSRKIVEHRCSDWVNAMMVADVDGDGVSEVVFGCLDETVQALKLSAK